MLLTIDKQIYGGDGLARLPADERGRGKAVFVPFTLAGEQVEATIVEQKPGFARARLGRIVEPSAQRIEPPCPYYMRCGGCHYQHTGYDHQLEIKTGVLRENLARFAKLDWRGEIAVHRSPEWNYRNRTRLQVRTQPEFALAYYRHGSHELLPVEQCPISSPLINRAIHWLRGIGALGQRSTELREIEFFADDTDTHLLIEFYIARTAAKELLFYFDPEAISRELPELSVVAAFATPEPARQFREPRLISATSVGKSHSRQHPALTYLAAGEHYRVSPGSFFQTNRFLVDTMVRLVTAGRSGKLALDLYAGVGLFAVPLARAFDRVVAVEASPFSFGDLKLNARANVQPVRDMTDRWLANKTMKPDLVVVDPPRAGLGDKVVRALTRMSPPCITYVSCDPATLARDLRGLLESGYRVEEIHLVDLFPQTFHIETLVQLAR